MHESFDYAQDTNKIQTITSNPHLKFKQLNLEPKSCIRKCMGSAPYELRVCSESYESPTDSVGVTCEDFVDQRFLNDKSLVFPRDSYKVGSYNQRCYKHGAALQPVSHHRMRYSLMHDLG